MTRRKSHAITRDQHDLTPEPQTDKDGEPDRVKARHLSADELRKAFEAEKQAQQKVLRQRRRRVRGLTPRLRPKIRYRDPGI